jgi:hypothetical protein
MLRRIYHRCGKSRVYHRCGKSRARNLGRGSHMDKVDRIAALAQTVRGAADAIGILTDLR